MCERSLLFIWRFICDLFAKAILVDGGGSGQNVAEATRMNAVMIVRKTSAQSSESNVLKSLQDLHVRMTFTGTMETVEMCSNS